MNMLYSKIILLIFALSLFLLGATPKRPFPQMELNSEIQEPQGTANQQAKISRDFYDNWKSSYIIPYDFTSGSEDGTGSGYLVEAGTNPSIVEGIGETVSQSEAHGWGMIIVSLMAGWDSEAKEIFDGLYLVHRNWPSSDHNDLMSWAVPANGKLLPQNRLPSATDGDMDAAYGLLLAHEQWGGNPEGMDISYFDAAIEIIKALEDNNILYAPESAPNASHFPRLGIGDSNGNYWDIRATRSSDFMLSHFRVFNEARLGDPEYRAGTSNGVPSVWSAVEQSTISIVNKLRDTETGLMPDFMGNQNGDFSQEISTFKGISDEPYDNPGGNDDSYWYNACRFPWRYAQGFIHENITEARDAVLPIGEWLVTADEHQEWDYFNQAKIGAGYYLSGWLLDGANYYDKSFVAPFMTALALGENSYDFNTLWQSVTQFEWPTDEYPHYYDNSVGLLNILLLTGNWWRPTPNDNSVATLESQTIKKKISRTLLANGSVQLNGLSANSQVSLVDLKGRILSVHEVSATGSVNISSKRTGVFIIKGSNFTFKSYIGK